PRRRHRRRSLRFLPPLPRGRRAHRLPRPALLPLLHLLAAGSARRARRRQPAGPGLLPGAARRAGRAGHRGHRHALPLGPAAGTPGRGRLGGPRYGRAVRRVRRAHRGGARRPGRPLDHPQRAAGGLGHGLATQALRAAGAAEVGITLDLAPVRVLGDAGSERLEQARMITEAAANGLYLGPVLHGRYPEHAPEAYRPPAHLIADGDLETISAPIDFLGVNYYQPVILRAGDPDDLRRNELPARCQVPGVVEYQPEELERTSM